jgi:hypothetical protein
MWKGSRRFTPAGNSFGLWTAAARDGESPVSVIAFKAPDQRTVDETAEDLNILSLILSQDLERAFANEAAEYKLGILMRLDPGGRSVEASYLEGFGAVFNLKVRFPLVAAAPEEKSAANNPIDSEWEKARRALTGIGDSAPLLWRPTPFEEGRPYDANLVESLKKKALDVLRNASHLRHVKPEEWVVLTFSGPPNAPESDPNPPVSSNEANPGLDSDSGQDWTQPGAPAPFGQTRPPESVGRGNAGGGQAIVAVKRAASTPGRLTILTIRTKKANADAFAAKKITEDQFLHAAEVTTYLGPAIVSGATGNYFRMQSR